MMHRSHRPRSDDASQPPIEKRWCIIAIDREAMMHRSHRLRSHDLSQPPAEKRWSIAATDWEPMIHRANFRVYLNNIWSKRRNDWQYCPLEAALSNFFPVSRFFPPLWEFCFLFLSLVKKQQRPVRLRFLKTLGFRACVEENKLSNIETITRGFDWKTRWKVARSRIKRYSRKEI